MAGALWQALSWPHCIRHGRAAPASPLSLWPQEQQKDGQRLAKAAAAAAKAAAKALENEQRKALRQAQSKTHSLKQVRLLVDSSLVSAGSLGVGLLGETQVAHRVVPGCSRGPEGGQGRAMRGMHARAAPCGRPARNATERNGPLAAHAQPAVWPARVHPATSVLAAPPAPRCPSTGFPAPWASTHRRPPPRPCSPAGRAQQPQRGR